MRFRITSLALLTSLTLTLTACGGDPAAAPAAEAPIGPPVGDGHGGVGGAAEVTEPQLGLTTVDRAGTVTHLDLLDESVRERRLRRRPGRGDDRRPLPVRRGRRTGSRSWTAACGPGTTSTTSTTTVPSRASSAPSRGGDRRRSPPRTSRPPAAPASSSPGPARPCCWTPRRCRRARSGSRFRLETGPHAGMVVPVGSFALVTDGGGRCGHLRRRPHRGRRADRPGGARAPSASGTITTRVGAVIGCADGALLASVAGRRARGRADPVPRGHHRAPRRPPSPTARAARPSPRSPGPRASGCWTPASGPGPCCPPPPRWCR